LPGHVYLLGEPFVVCQFTDGGQHIMSMIDPKCSFPMIDGSEWLTQPATALETGVWATVKWEVKAGGEKQF
jgi:hypothetical protein